MTLNNAVRESCVGTREVGRQFDWALCSDAQAAWLTASHFVPFCTILVCHSLLRLAWQCAARVWKGTRAPASPTLTQHWPAYLLLVQAQDSYCQA